MVDGRGALEASKKRGPRRFRGNACGARYLLSGDESSARGQQDLEKRSDRSDGARK